MPYYTTQTASIALIAVVTIIGLSLTYLNYKMLTTMEEVNKKLEKVAKLLESLG
ncbi:MAG: hypothetical protein Q7J10_10600 [Methanosarcinaceae archaeon]|nr:hypothetical protein [Methanosarcinaceae archaeon]